jgi:hypothetical protein
VKKIKSCYRALRVTPLDVGVLDGYLLAINTPSKKYAKNVRSYFLGHYQRNGVNIQAMCDAHCRFTFLGGVGGGPGVTIILEIKLLYCISTSVLKLQLMPLKLHPCVTPNHGKYRRSRGYKGSPGSQAEPTL